MILEEYAEGLKKRIADAMDDVLKAKTTRDALKQELKIVKAGIEENQRRQMRRQEK